MATKETQNEEETGLESLLVFLQNLLFMVSGAMTLRPCGSWARKLDNDWAREPAGSGY